MMGMRRVGMVGVVCAVVVAVFGVAAGRGSGSASTRSAATFTTPIQHVVVIYQENHAFDNVLGKLCVRDHRCNGATSGKLPGGATIMLKQATDVVPPVTHNHNPQQVAIDGGKMDGFAKISGCTRTQNYRCYSQFAPWQIPNLAALARNFVISDHTYEMHTVPSWGAHLRCPRGPGFAPRARLRSSVRTKRRRPGGS